MVTKEMDFLDWLHKMRKEEKAKRKDKSTKLFLQEIKQRSIRVLKEQNITLPVLERTKIKA